VSSENDMTTPVLYAFLWKFQYYLDVIDDKIANGAGDIGEMTILTGTQRINIWGSLYSIATSTEEN
jgi:hypothetical protein